MLSHTNNSFTLALSLSTAAAGIRGATWALPRQEAKKTICAEELEIKILCRGNCSISPSKSPAANLNFDIEIKTKTGKKWQLKEVVMAAGSVTRPFEYLPLSTDPQGRDIVPVAALFCHM